MDRLRFFVGIEILIVNGQVAALYRDVETHAGSCDRASLVRLVLTERTSSRC